MKIQFDYLENEEFKAKLPALLQSKDHPSVFDFKDSFYPVGVQVFMSRGKDIQTKLAVGGLSMPMVKGTAEAIQNPFYKALALEVNHSDWTCLAMDQLLGRETGRVFNNETLAVAAGTKSPDQAAQPIESFWSTPSRTIRLYTSITIVKDDGA